MNAEQAKLLLNALLKLWELSIVKEGELTLMLDDLHPLWRNRIADYVQSPGAIARASLLVSPMRKATEAVLKGECTPDILQALIQEAAKKPN